MDSVNVSFGHRLWWVDAFIGEAERGNPAVVVLLERPMEDHELQQIAFELGVSETAFVRRVGDTWSLRWFTPTVEVDLCGHATLGDLARAAQRVGRARRRVLLSDPLGRPLGATPERRPARRRPAALVHRAARRVGAERHLGARAARSTRPGAQSVLAVVEDYDTLCGLAVDPMSLFLVPSSHR